MPPLVIDGNSQIEVGKKVPVLAGQHAGESRLGLSPSRFIDGPYPRLKVSADGMVKGFAALKKGEAKRIPKGPNAAPQPPGPSSHISDLLRRMRMYNI
jgi:hypothetical protein